MKSRRKAPEINSGSMADISFLLLSFFLLTSNINSDKGIARKLPPLSALTQSMNVNKRNVLKVLVNMDDQLLVNGKPGSLSTLKDEVVLFLTNPMNNPNLSEQKSEEIGGLGMVRKSKGVVSLQNDRNTSYEMYINVQNELTKAINEIRDKLCLNKFGKKYIELNDELQKDVQSAVPFPISEAEPKNIGGTK